jgi:hypothetical protein
VVGPFALVGSILALALPTWAHAGGGNYLLVGGTKTERHAVVAALEASSFHWDLVPRRIIINIVRGEDSHAIPGELWLDADLLDAGVFAWGVVQHEYAHQVDFLVLSNEQRGVLLRALGGSAWCSEVPGLTHADYGCERFASTLAWSYWPSPDNCMRPETSGDESAALPPSQFRALIESMLMPRRFRGMR